MGSFRIGMDENKIAELVEDYFSASTVMAEERSTALISLLNELSSLFSGAAIPATDIAYSHQSISLHSDSVSRPDAPTLSIDEDAPAMGELASFSMPTITIPSYTITEPVAELIYNEAIYQSDIRDALKIALLEFIESGGTGLGADAEDALWARGRAERDLLNEKAYDEAEEFIASKGYCVPAGALNGLRSRILVEQTRTDAAVNFKIMIEQARLARAQSEHTMTASITLEGQEKEHFNNVANRTLECAKAAVQVILGLYTAKVMGYSKQMEGAKIAVEAKKTEIDAIVAGNKSIVDAYSADIEGYKAKLQAEIGIVEAFAKLYGFEVAGYRTDAEIVAIDLDAQIKAYQSKIDQANNQTALSLQEAEITIRSYLKAVQLTDGAASSGGGLSAQAVASALSAINVSASMGDSVFSNAKSNVSDTKSRRSSINCSEIHRYDHTG